MVRRYLIRFELSKGFPRPPIKNIHKMKTTVPVAELRTSSLYFSIDKFILSLISHRIEMIASSEIEARGSALGLWTESINFAKDDDIAPFSCRGLWHNDSRSRLRPSNGSFHPVDAVADADSK